MRDKLFERVLLEPALESAADRLTVVAGYATPAMASRHIEALLAQRTPLREIELVIGMTGESGLPVSVLEGFLSLRNRRNTDILSVSCMPMGQSDHAKGYVWFRGSLPVEGWQGSANYTQAAFGGIRGRSELMAAMNADSLLRELASTLRSAVPLAHPELGSLVDIVADDDWDTERSEWDDSHHPRDSGRTQSAGEEIVLSLIKSNGDLPQRSGLNWGQRAGRDPDQAYLSVPVSIGAIDYFPAPPAHFTIVADDGVAFVVRRAQQGGKAITTPFDNAELGRYFRRRLGVAPGAAVTREALEEYGSTTVGFRRTSSGSFEMNFSPGRDARSSEGRPAGHK